ncbi:hypothetical protein J6590_037660 [Homalodisca vitripennis]|nr:hypothetical protein J6590_037660 [Homalodisca vitripennis]
MSSRDGPARPLASFIHRRYPSAEFSCVHPNYYRPESPGNEGKDRRLYGKSTNAKSQGGRQHPHL